MTQKCYDCRGRARTSLDLWPDQQSPNDHLNLLDTSQTFHAAERRSGPVAALQIICCTVPHIPRLLNEHFVRVFIFSSPAFSLRPWSQCGQGRVGWRVVFVHGLELCQTANIFSKNQPRRFLLDHRECPQAYEARQKSSILLLADKCFYLEHFVFIPNCINQDQGRAKDRMIHLPKRGWGSNPRGVLFVHNLKKGQSGFFFRWRSNILEVQIKKYGTNFIIYSWLCWK